MYKTMIKIRPFIPYMGESNREPFAILSYGGITIEIDYTIMRYIALDVKSDVYTKTVGIAHAGFQEIVKEMESDLYGKIAETHRDGNHPFLKSITNNPLHPINIDNITITK